MRTNQPILYAEDDENDVFLLKLAFESAGIQNPLQVASDGQQAIEYLSGTGGFADRFRHPLPCLVLLDLKMPRVPGLEVLAWLRQKSAVRQIPVIVFSSSSRLEDIRCAYELGANSFVVKPTAVDERVLFAKALKEFWLHFTEACPEVLKQRAA